MTRDQATKLALSVLESFRENSAYEDYKADDVLPFTDEQYAEMLTVLAKPGPFTIMYEMGGVVHRIGPFDTEAQADAAARKAQAHGEFDIDDQNVYLLDPSHRVIEYALGDLTEDTSDTDE